jgi:hypothetical protein
MDKFEPMAELVKRLSGSDASAQAKAVVEAIKLIESAPGYLDQHNRATALYHLSVALSGRDHAAETLETASFLASDVR